MNRSTPTLLLISLAGLLTAASSALAGQLSPPPGPIAPTGRFGPRIEISQATTPGDADSVFRIVSPGSYYLSANVIGQTGKTGIEIASSQVTIDLMGFKLRGSPGTLSGIGAVFPVSSVTIRNGVISGWGGDGISLQFSGEGALIEGIHAIGNTGTGIVSMRYAIISSCTTINNGKFGIHTFDSSVVSSSVARSNGLDGFSCGSGSVIDGSTANSNGRDGFMLGSDSTITACSARFNSADGISTIQDSIVQNCAAGFNTMAGISVGVRALVVECTSSSNSAGGITVKSGSLVLDCQAAFNSIAGIALTDSATVRGCTVRFATGDGITGQKRNLIQDNHVSGSNTTGSGIRLTQAGNRVDNNFATSSLRGFLATANNNLFTRNSSTGNTFNYDLSSGNFARVVAASSSSAIVGDAGGVAVAPVDPLINIAF